MAGIYKTGFWALSIIAFLTTATYATAADTPATAVQAAPFPPPLVTLEAARKKAHERVDVFDKMSVEEWKTHREKFQDFMDKVSKMTPEEKQKTFPNMPPSMLGNLGHPKPPAGAKFDDTAMLKKAREHAHAHADKLDKMTSAQWDEEQKKTHDFLVNYPKMSPQERQAMAMRGVEQHKIATMQAAAAAKKPSKDVITSAPAMSFPPAAASGK